MTLTADTTERAAVIWAPGRVNLIGEHTDYSGGLVLPAAISSGSASRRDAADGEVALDLERLRGRADLRADGSGAADAGWARYAQAVAAELALLGRPPVGLAGTVSSDLPAGAGLSSSAALEVAVALALCAVARLRARAARARARLPARRAARGRGAVRDPRPGGVPARTGRGGDPARLRHPRAPPRRRAPRASALFIVDSGVERSLENTAYAERRAELEHALGLVGAARSTEVDVSDLEGLDDVSHRRLRHVVTENERVRQFAAALERDDLATAGRLLGESHASLRDDYEVSIPELDLLVELAEAAGAYGARLLGGGFGGSVLVLTDAGRSDAVAGTMSARVPAAGRQGQPHARGAPVFGSGVR